MASTPFLMPQTCYIYTLHASNDPECRPRYVGFTVRLKRRAIEHNTGYEQGRKNVWIKELLAVGAWAELVVVHTFESDDGLERGIVEADWIEKYRDEFTDLLNDASGGDGLAPCSPELRAKRRWMNFGRVPTAEQREKLRQSKLGRPRPPHVIEALRKANLGKKWSAERRAERSKLMTGRKASPETLEKMKKAQQGRKPSRETLAKASAVNRGRKLSPEHRAKIAAAGIGRKASPETCAKRGALLRGKKRSPEQIERIKAAARLRASTPEYREACSAGQKRRFAKLKEASH